MSVVDRTGRGQVRDSPPGIRLARRRWRDPRLVAGVLLVGASVTGMAWVIGASDDTVEVWSVSDDLPAGSPVETGSLTKVRIDVPDSVVYVSTDTAIASGAVATRDFAAGELLTLLGVDDSGTSESLRIVTLPVLRHQMPADLSVGDRVDVYLVERSASGEPQARPELVLASAIVSDVDDNGGAFGGTSLETGVALSVPQGEVATVVDAQARGTVTLVDVPVGSP
ncbi:MAG TPA: hypothetical protein VMX11_03760 [Actinomycetes bacterium]|nr:hypothetical protein [Actinomycetes bacterium]